MILKSQNSKANVKTHKQSVNSQSLNMIFPYCLNFPWTNEMNFEILKWDTKYICLYTVGHVGITLSLFIGALRPLPVDDTL